LDEFTVAAGKNRKIRSPALIIDKARETARRREALRARNLAESRLRGGGRRSAPATPY